MGDILVQDRPKTFDWIEMWAVRRQLDQMDAASWPGNKSPDKRVIHVIWDNAAYHKGPDVRAFLAMPDCRIHLIQLPLLRIPR